MPYSWLPTATRQALGSVNAPMPWLRRLLRAYTSRTQGTDDWQEIETEVGCDLLYEVYKSLKETHASELESGRNIVLTGDDLRDISESLYDTLKDEAEEDMSAEDEADIRLTVSKAFFDEVL